MRPLQLLRVSLRRLAKRPLFTATTVLCIALGVGAATSIFTVIDALLLRPTPVRELEDVVFFMAMREGVEPFGVSAIEIQAYQNESHSFDGLGIAESLDPQAIDSGDGELPERVETSAIARSYLETLGVTPDLGRSFSPEEDRPGGPPVVLLSHGLWRRRFGASPDVLGKTFRLEGESHTIVGVLPEGFDLPRRTEVWLPMRFDPERMSEDERGSHANMMVGRLADGMSLERAEEELVGIARSIQRDFPRTNSGWSVAIIPLRDFLLGDFQGRIRGMLLVLGAAVVLLLLTTSFNAAQMFLARFTEQRSDIELHAALGASRGQLLSPLLVESLLVAALGGGLGFVFTRSLVPLLMGTSPLQQEAYSGFFRDVPVDAGVLAFAIGASLLTALLFGVAPALASTRGRDPRLSRSRSRSRYGSRGFAAVLIASEVAVSIALLVGAGLLFRSFERLSALDLGFRPQGLVSMDFTLPHESFPEASDRLAFMERVLERVRALPSVEAAGMTTDVPLRQGTWDTAYTVEGAEVDPSRVEMTANRIVSPGYIETLGLSLLRGRTLAASDREGTDPVVVVSETLARRAWPEADPIGKRVKAGPSGDDDAPWMTVVGVVADVKEDRYNFRIDRPVWYLPYAQQTEDELDYLSLVVRGRGDVDALAGSVRRAAASLYPELPPGEVLDLKAHAAGVLATERFGSYLGLVVAGLATALAAIGLYGVLAYSVRHQVRELGIRAALGAAPPDLVRMVVTQGMAVSAIGILVGAVLSLALGSYLSSLLFEVSPRDPFVLGAVTVFLAVVAVAACYVPARRASRTDPTETLRVE